VSADHVLILLAMGFAVLASALERVLDRRARERVARRETTAPALERRTTPDAPQRERAHTEPLAAGATPSVERPLPTRARAALEYDRRPSARVAAATGPTPPARSQTSARALVRATLREPKRLREVLRVLAVLEPARARSSERLAQHRQTIGAGLTPRRR
jgi:hypothetical protein